MSDSIDIEGIDWDKGAGLVPAIVQDCRTGGVLMLGYMNQAALAQTMQTSKVTFYSRSQQKLWTKGETSGNFLQLDRLFVDCDSDTILVTATPAGPTCHKGTYSCFFDNNPVTLSFLGTLQNVVAERANNKQSGSYTAKLLNAGPKRIGQKIGEEGVEVALALASNDREELINESSDLLYHLLVGLQAADLSLEDVCKNLIKRHQGA